MAKTPVSSRSNVFARDFMLLSEPYTPHREWLLAVAFMLRDAAKDNIEIFWTEEAPVAVSKHHRAITDLIDALDYFDGDISQFMKYDYYFKDDVAALVETGVFTLVSTMLSYLSKQLKVVEEFYNMEFFSGFPYLEDAANEFAELTWGKDVSFSDSDFGLSLILYYHHTCGLEIPEVFEYSSLANNSVDEVSINFSVLGKLFKYFYVEPDTTWNETCEEVVVECNHYGASLVFTDGKTICGRCNETIDDQDQLWNDPEFAISVGGWFVDY